MSLLTRRGQRNRTNAGPIDPPEADAPAGSAGDKGPGDECQPICDVRWRQRARVSGRLRSVRVQPWADVPTLECTLVDDTGGITVVFLGRREIAGIHPGTLLRVEGMAGSHHGKLAMLNADYTLLDA